MKDPLDRIFGHELKEGTKCPVCHNLIDNRTARRMDLEERKGKPFVWGIILSMVAILIMAKIPVPTWLDQTISGYVIAAGVLAIIWIVSGYRYRAYSKRINNQMQQEGLV